VLALSGLTVAQMVYDYFGLHSTQLTALGVSQPSSTDLSPLTVVPLNPVQLTGRIFDAVDNLLAQWAPKYQTYIDPTDLTIRIIDVTDPDTTQQFTLPATPSDYADWDTAKLTSISFDTTNCYTQVVLRGSTLTDAAILDQALGSLTKGWTNTQEADWTLQDYLYPSNSSVGTVSSMTSLTLTIAPVSGVLTWGLNYWNQGTISAYLLVGGTPTIYETREIVACTATSGGSATITVDYDFAGSGYNGYEIRGPIVGENLVWRKYTIPDAVVRPSDNTAINLHLVKTLSHSVAWSPGDDVVVQTTAPQGEIYHSIGCVAANYDAGFGSIQIYPSNDGTTPGFIAFDQPTVMAFSSYPSLVAGKPDGIPCDIKALVPYSMGVLSAQAPDSGYEGTAYSEYGVERTWYKDYPNWNYGAQASNMGTLAQDILDSVKNVVIEGSLEYYGCPIDAMTLGQGINITGGFATDDAFLPTMNCAIRRIQVEWPENAGSWQVCTFQFSNQRKPYLGDALFVHPVTQRRDFNTGFSFGVSQAGIDETRELGIEQQVNSRQANDKIMNDALEKSGQITPEQAEINRDQLKQQGDQQAEGMRQSILNPQGRLTPDQQKQAQEQQAKAQEEHKNQDLPGTQEQLPGMQNQLPGMQTGKYNKLTPKEQRLQRAKAKQMKAAQADRTKQQRAEAKEYKQTARQQAPIAKQIRAKQAKQNRLKNKLKHDQNNSTRRLASKANSPQQRQRDREAIDSQNFINSALAAQRTPTDFNKRVADQQKPPELSQRTKERLADQQKPDRPARLPDRTPEGQAQKKQHEQELSDRTQERLDDQKNQRFRRPIDYAGPDPDIGSGERQT
jgi:hypothetical protein